MSGVICVNCGTKNSHGALICAHCHAPLVRDDMSTRPATAAMNTRSLPFGRKLRTAHEGKMGAQAIALYLNNEPTPFIVLLPSELIFGRLIPGDNFPCFDLTPFGAHERGVSRRHMILKRAEKGITAEDMGSSNGTWLNDILMKAYVPAVLQTGDRIRLSQLDVEIYFP